MTKDLRSDVAHSARVYDYWLGGKDNFAPDRALGETIKEALEAVPRMVKGFQLVDAGLVCTIDWHPERDPHPREGVTAADAMCWVALARRP